MDWAQWLANWGPAAPFLLFGCKACYDLVYTIIPQGFEEIERRDEHARRLATKRHRQHMRMQAKIRRAIEHQASKCDRRAGARGRKRPAK